MKSGLLIALVVAVLFVLTGLAKAHDHPPPISCSEWCGDANCKCWERCKAVGGDNWPAPSDCTRDCNAAADRCERECGT